MNHEIIFSKDQSIVFERLKSIKNYLNKKHFQLFGGTALALHIGHRRSYDFDFITPQSINPKEVAKNIISVLPELTIVRTKKNTLDCQWKTAKLSFFGGISRPFLFPTIAYEHLKLLSIPDILAMKISAMMERNVIRDYFDVATVLQFEGVTVKNLIDWFRQKYGEEARQFSDSWIIKCIAYLDDVPSELPVMTKHQDFWKGGAIKDNMKKIFDTRVAEYLEGI